MCSFDSFLAHAFVKSWLRQAYQDVCFSPCWTTALAKREMNGIFGGRGLRTPGTRPDIRAKSWEFNTDVAEMLI